jgi:hypothetical protein
MNAFQEMIVKVAKTMSKSQKEQMLKAFEEKHKDHPQKEELMKQMKEALGYDAGTEAQK